MVVNELVEIIKGKTADAHLDLLILLMIAASILPSFLHTIENYLSWLFWFFLEEKFTFLVLKKRGEIDVAVHEDPQHNNLFNKISENGVHRIQSFTDRQFYLMQNSIETIIAAAIIITFQWKIFLLIFIGTIPELITEIRYGRNVWGIHSGRAEIRRRYWDVSRHFNWLPSLVELKLFQNVSHFLSIIKSLFRAFRMEERRNERNKLTYQLLSLTLSNTVIAFATVWFIFQVVNGQLQLGTLWFIISSIGELRSSFSSLFSNLGRHYQDSLFVADVFKLLDLKPVVKKPRTGVALPARRTPEIIFRNMTFAYPNTNREVFKNFSLRIAPGEKIALVGINGAGKTTLVKLLCRFYDPQKGEIEINGHNLKTIDLNQWYSQLGILFQDYADYHFLVREAVAVGKTTVQESIRRIKRAAKASEADAFIEEWEKRYGQMLGKEFTGGIEPSIGQWQKLALARTFYRDPRILILDEPTSSIDAEAEAKIFERLEKLPKDRTVILISHRFSTVRHADHIVVIEDGIIKEQGTHEELLKHNSSYARLFRLQAKGYR